MISHAGDGSRSPPEVGSSSPYFPVRYRYPSLVTGGNAAEGVDAIGVVLRPIGVRRRRGFVTPSILHEAQRLFDTVRDLSAEQSRYLRTGEETADLKRLRHSANEQFGYLISQLRASHVNLGEIFDSTQRSEVERALGMQPREQGAASALERATGVIARVKGALAGLPSARQKHSKFGILDVPNLLADDIARSPATRIAVLYLDIDAFKKLNTQYSEREVDRSVLPRFQSLILELVGQHGHCYAEGGDEIIILLINVTPGVAVAFAEDIRAAVQSHAFDVKDDTVMLTVSIGVAVGTRDSGAALADLANELKTRAKAQGRNRVEANLPPVIEAHAVDAPAAPLVPDSSVSCVIAPASQSTMSRSEPMDERIMLTVSPKSICSLFQGRTATQGNKLAAVYVGKWITLSGVIGDIDDQYGHFFVSFQQALGDHPRIIMRFNEVWRERLEIINPGDTASVLGKVSTASEFSLVLHDCELKPD
jgi:diguanylate cyclase (GGDEF)-like protein